MTISSRISVENSPLFSNATVLIDQLIPVQRKATLRQSHITESSSCRLEYNVPDDVFKPLKLKPKHRCIHCSQVFYSLV